MPDIAVLAGNAARRSGRPSLTLQGMTWQSGVDSLRHSNRATFADSGNHRVAIELVFHALRRCLLSPAVLRRRPCARSAGRAAGAADAICDHLLRRRARHRAMAAQPALAARTGAHFTYFLSCVFLLSPETRHDYQAPGQGAGKSECRFRAIEGRRRRPARRDLACSRRKATRSPAMPAAISTATTGAEADWLTGIRVFRAILGERLCDQRHRRRAGRLAGVRRHGVKGFRAPYLSTGKGLYEALADAGFAYDASGISRGPVEPAAGRRLARFALPQIPEGPSGRRVIAMDYNLFVRHSGGFERPDEARRSRSAPTRPSTAPSRRNIGGKRTPLQLGFHFTLMNDGAYWRALERFAEDVCVKPDVVCISYRDYLAAQRSRRLAPPTQPASAAEPSAADSASAAVRLPSRSRKRWSISGSGAPSSVASKARRRL